MHPNELARYSTYDETAGTSVSNINDAGKQAVVEARLWAINNNPAAAKEEVRRQNQRIAATNTYRQKVLDPFFAKDSRYSLSTENINGEMYNRVSFKQKGRESWSANLGVIPGGEEGLGQLTVNDAMVAPFYPVFGDRGQRPTSAKIQQGLVEQLFKAGHNPFEQVQSILGREEDDAKLIWNNPSMLGAGGPGKLGKLANTWRLPDNIHFDNAPHRLGAGVTRITALSSQTEEARKIEAEDLYPNDFRARQIALGLKPGQDAALGHEQDIYGDYVYKRGQGVHVQGLGAYGSVPGTAFAANGDILKANEDPTKGMKRLGLSGNFDYNYGPTRAGSSAVDQSWQNSVVMTQNGEMTSGYAMQELLLMSSGGILGGGHGLINSNTQGQNQIWENKSWSFDLPGGTLSDEQESYLKENQGRVLNRDAFLEINGQKHNFTDNWDAAQIKDWDVRDGKLTISGERFGAKMSAKYGTKSFLSSADFSEQGFADPSINSLDMIHEMSGDPAMVSDLILGGFNPQGMAALIQEHMTNVGMSEVGQDALSSLAGGGSIQRDERSSAFLNEAFTETLLPKLFEHQEITRTWDTNTFNETVVGNAHVLKSEVLDNGQTQATVRVGALRIGGNVTLNGQEVPVRKLENFRPELSGQRASLNDMLRRNQLEYGDPNAMGAVTSLGIQEGSANRSLLRSSLASKGFAEPELSTSFDSMTQATAQGHLDKINAAYAAAGIDPDSATEFQRQSTILETMKGEAGFSFGMAGGKTGYIPSPETAQRFGIQSDTGESQGYMKSYTDLLHGQLQQIAMGGGGEVDAKTATAMMRKQESLASGGNFVKHALGGAKTEGVEYAHYIGANELAPNEQIVHPTDLARMMFAGRQAQGWKGSMEDIRAEISAAESSGAQSITTVSGARSPSLGKELGTMYFNAMTPAMARANRGWRGSIRQGMIAANDVAIAAWGGDKDADAASLFEAATVLQGGVNRADATTPQDIIRRARENPAGELQNQRDSAYGEKYGQGVEGAQTAFRNLLGGRFTRSQMGGEASSITQDSKRQMGEHYNRAAGFIAAKSAMNMSDPAAAAMDKFIGGQYQAALDLKAGDISEGAQILRDTASANLTTGYRTNGTVIPGLNGPQTIQEQITNKENGIIVGGNKPASILDAFSKRLVSGVLQSDEMSSREAALALAPSGYEDIIGLATQIASQRDSFSTLTGEARNAAVAASVRHVEGNILGATNFGEGETRSLLNTDAPISLMMGKSALREVGKGRNFNVPTFDKTLENLAHKGAIVDAAINVFGNSDANLGELAVSAQMLRANQANNPSAMNAVSDSLLGQLGISGDQMTAADYSRRMAEATKPAAGPQLPTTPRQPVSIPAPPSTRVATTFNPSSVSNPLQAMASAFVGRGLINTNSDASELGNEIHEQFGDSINWTDKTIDTVGGAPLDINSLKIKNPNKPGEFLTENRQSGTWLETSINGVSFGGYADKVVQNLDTGARSVVDFKTTGAHNLNAEGGLKPDKLEDAFMQAKIYRDALGEAGLDIDDIRIQAVNSDKYKESIAAGHGADQALEMSLGKSHSWTEHYGSKPEMGVMPPQLQKRFEGYNALATAMSEATGAKGGLAIQARGAKDPKTGVIPPETYESTLAGVGHMHKSLQAMAGQMTSELEGTLGVTAAQLSQGLADPDVRNKIYGYTEGLGGDRAGQAAMLTQAIDSITGGGSGGSDDGSGVSDSSSSGTGGNFQLDRYGPEALIQRRIERTEMLEAQKQKRNLTQDDRSTVAQTMAQFKTNNWKGQWQYLQGKAANGEQLTYHEAKQFNQMQDQMMKANSIVSGAVGAGKAGSYVENNAAAQQISQEFGASWGATVGTMPDEVSAVGSGGDAYRKTRDNAAVAIAKGKPLDLEFSATKADSMMGQANMLGKMFESLNGVMTQVTNTGGKLTEQQAKQVEANLKTAESLSNYMDTVKEAAAVGNPAAQNLLGRYNRLAGGTADDTLSKILGTHTGEGSLGEAVGQIRQGYQSTISEDSKDPLWKRYMRATMSKGLNRDDKLAELFGSEEWKDAGLGEKAAAVIPGATAGVASHMIRDSWMYNRVAQEFFQPGIEGASKYREYERGRMGGLVSSGISASSIVNTGDYSRVAGMDARLANRDLAFGRTSQETWGSGIEALSSVKNSGAFSLAMPIVGAGLMGQLAGAALPGGLAIGGQAIAPMLPGVLMAGAATVAMGSSAVDYKTNTAREYNLVNRIQTDNPLGAFLSDPMGSVMEAGQAVFDNEKWQKRMGALATAKSNTNYVMGGGKGNQLGAADTLIYQNRLWNENFKDLESVGMTEEMFSGMFGATNKVFGTLDPTRQQQTLEAMSSSIMTGSMTTQDYEKAAQSYAIANSGIGIQAPNSQAKQDAMFNAAQMEKWRPGSVQVGTQLADQFLAGSNAESAMLGRGRYDVTTETGRFMDANSATQIAMQEEYKRKNQLQSYGVDKKYALQYSRESAVGLDPIAIAASRAEQAGISTDDAGFAKILTRSIEEFSLGDNASIAEIAGKRKKAREEGMVTQMGNLAQRFGQTALSTKGLTEEQFGYTADLAQSTGFYSQQYGFDTSKLMTTQVAQNFINQPNGAGYAQAQRFQQMGAMGLQQAASYSAYGNNNAASVNFMQQLAMQSGGDMNKFNQGMAVIQGDPIANSQYARQNGLLFNANRYLVQTGEGGSTKGMSRSYDEKVELGMQLRYASTANKFGISMTGEQLAMNDVDVERAQRSEDIGFRDFGFAMQNKQQRRSEASTFGTGLSALRGDTIAGGQALGLSGADVNRYASALKDGQGEWYLEDRNVALSRKQQDFGYAQETAQLGIAQTRFQQSGTQYSENLALRQQQQGVSWQYQQQDITRGNQRAQTQLQWSGEDLNYSRNMNQMQFGWQMQDFDRNIRYARGRERQDLLRQQERAVITQAAESGKMDREEGRLETKKGWQNEDTVRETQRFEQSKKMTQEQMALEARHYAQNRALEAQQMELQTQAHNKQKAFMTEERTLEDQSRNLRRAIQIQEVADQRAQNARSQQHARTMQQLTDVMNVHQKSLTEDSTALAYAAKTGELLSDSLALVNPKLATFQQTMNGIAVSAANAVQVALQAAARLSHAAPTRVQHAPVDGAQIPGGRGFRSGGYTGSTPGTKGSVHEEEVVVTRDGNLMVQGDNPHAKRTADGIEKLIEVMKNGGRGSMNLTINTNDVKTATSAAMSLADQVYSRP